jgi:hypothetical protein
MTEYYVSAAGNDSNDGSYTAPWKTLDKVNSISWTFALRDRVNFRRGDTFYGKLRPPKTLDPSQPGWLRYGAYGENAAAPVLSGYKLLNTAAGWVQHAADTWKINVSQANLNVTYTGNGVAAERTGDIGILKVDGVIKAWKRKTLATLVDQWDFYYDEAATTLYVRSTANPTTVAGNIQASYDLDGVWGRSCVEVSDLTIEGYGGCGVYVAVSGEAVNRFRLLRNTIRDIGGSYLDGYKDSVSGEVGTSRYGNGVVVWNGASNFYGEYNKISDCFDSAWTIQCGSNSAGQTAGFTNIVWRRNLGFRCSQAEEYMYYGTGPGFVGCRSEHNTYMFMGYGFGRDTRLPDNYADRPYLDYQTGYATYLWGDNAAHVADLKLLRNVFYDCSYSLCMISGGQFFPNYTPSGLVSDYNVIALRPGTLMQSDNYGPDRVETVENFTAWADLVKREQHSTLIQLPASTDTDISDADVAAALSDLKAAAVGGQVVSIQAPWM